MQRFKDESNFKSEKATTHPRVMIRHPKSRAGFMLNGLSCHASGANVKPIGANREELHGAVIIEISPFPDVQKTQIDANIKIAAASKGLLAMPTGEEQHMSIGTGHMVAFCRAASKGCRTVFKSIKSPDGNISLEILKKDAEFKKMLAEGWDFKLLP